MKGKMGLDNVKTSHCGKMYHQVSLELIDIGSDVTQNNRGKR